MADAEFLGPYRVGALIGRGGMGSVYEAVHETSGERVAVKLISQHVADEMRFRRRFAGEVETLKRLRHPNIVRLIGYGEERGQLFYSMELVQGETIQSIIRRDKRLPWPRVLDIAIQTTSALKHAHDFGVIHRDLKPANLLVGRDNQIKLVDFGIAKLFGFGEQTMAGSILGTADYMAPEQADGTAVTPRTDLYALGSSLYAMLCGRPPFLGSSTTRVIESLRHDRPVSLRLINEEIPIDLVELVDELLAKSPEDRPPTALAVGNRLKAMKAGLLRDRTICDLQSATLVGDDPERAEGQIVADRSPSDFAIAADPADSAIDHATRKTGSDGPITRLHDASDSDPLSADRSQVPMRSVTPAGKSVRRGSSLGDSAANGSSPVGIAGPSDLTVEGLHDAPTVRPTHRSPSVASDSSRVGQSVSADATPTPRTHFQTVGESSSLDHDTDRDGVVDRYWWVHAASIVGMVGVLLAGLVLFVMATRTPSADDLYRRIIDGRGAKELSSVEPLMRLFVSSYPEDDRVLVVRDLQQQLELERELRRLSFAAKRVDGVDHLPPHEQAFLRAMQIRGSDPQEATRRLNDWLAVYFPAGQVANLQIESMAALVRSELTRLAGREPQIAADPRVEELLRTIRTGRELGSEPRIEMLQGIISLHGEDDWAQPVVEEARQQLALIRESSPKP